VCVRVCVVCGCAFVCVCVCVLVMHVCTDVNMSVYAGLCNYCKQI
jgi:hypothetical protein